MVKCYITIQTYCKRYRIRKDDVQHIHHIKKRTVPMLPAYAPSLKIEDGFTSCEEEGFEMEGMEFTNKKHYSFQWNSLNRKSFPSYHLNRLSDDFYLFTLTHNFS